MSRFGAIAVGNPRSMNARSVAETSRSSPIGPLNLPARTFKAGVKRKSKYASCSTVVPAPKSGITLKSKFLKSVPSNTGRTRRRTKVSAAGCSGPPLG
jgi:hypothetical protein